MKGTRILIAGTGGQGVITAARLLCDFFAARGHNVVSGQLHGMAQRGGSVQSLVMIDAGISPALARGSADILLGFEPVETARALPYCSSETTVIFNRDPIVPFVVSQRFARGDKEARYPELTELEQAIAKVTDKVLEVDASEAAIAAGNVKTLNVVLLGCLFGMELLPASAAEFLDSIKENAPRRSAAQSDGAFMSGVALGRQVSAQSPLAQSHESKVTP